MMLSSIVSSVASGAMVMAETATTAGWYGVTTESFDPVIDNLTQIMPIALPVALTVLALRKGANFLLGFVRGA